MSSGVIAVDIAGAQPRTGLADSSVGFVLYLKKKSHDPVSPRSLG
jgi:hypothetical protein